MKALRCNAAETAPALEEMNVPVPAAGEILLEIEACALNFADLLMLKGTYQDTPPLPFTPGMEAAGRISAVGEGVALHPGQRVAVFGGAGGLAEMGVFAASRAVPLPDDMPSDIAAAMQVAYGTSHIALTHRARLQPGETLVVLGATGGVGTTATEIGRILGAKVIGVAAGADKKDAVLAAGAHHFLDSETCDLRTEIKALGGADVVYDPVGGDLFKAAFRACNPEARIVLIGFASGTLPEFRPNHMLVKNIDILGFYWSPYFTLRPELARDSLATLMDWYRAGRIHPRISHHFPLDRAMEGFETLRRRQATGKVVITM
ncbi:NADPH:quinone oxidoreductase family protein [Pseudooceanicola algae]|uniref:2-haloacrylate reductase n=1 Tax=Pseudooceanicola algae TaxID=1537215 RepID=A0A418SKS3_9RHOB|nr:NADPH:quinone oxidoreductase family protein [Pseudooceanicola algae]QPM90981.1 2-haloacrylate reductase [Pseudooceanicola algae]